MSVLILLIGVLLGPAHAQDPALAIRDEVKQVQDRIRIEPNLQKRVREFRGFADRLLQKEASFYKGERIVKEVIEFNVALEPIFHANFNRGSACESVRGEILAKYPKTSTPEAKAALDFLALICREEKLREIPEDWDPAAQ